MFIFIPLVLIFASIAVISVIFFRKMPYLNKLTPETHLPVQSNVVSNILTDLFPEFSEGFKGLKLKEYGHLWLLELEKFLRKLRLVSLKIDRISESWIKKIRKGHGFPSVTPTVEEKIKVTKTPVLKAHHASKINLEEIKKEEQRLIIEIAKNPKGFELYEALGDLYLKMKNLSDAKESFEAAIELNPHNEELQKKLSQVIQKLI